jgi:hypothetical protein
MQAQVAANLDVHGEGRLGEDKKPGQVSSRTRQQVRTLDKLSADGTIPERESPKYDLSGDLAWSISSIEKSREVVVDGSPSVEFLVKAGPSCSAVSRRHQIQEGKVKKFWEDVATMNSLDCRWSINEFYEKNPKAYGAQSKCSGINVPIYIDFLSSANSPLRLVVLDAWRLRDFEPGHDGKIKVLTENRLQSHIGRQAVAEKKRAEEAVRMAREAAKAAKVDKKALDFKMANTIKGSHGGLAYLRRGN